VTDDQTTREAVERVRGALDAIIQDTHPDEAFIGILDPNWELLFTRDDCDVHYVTVSTLRTVLAALDRVTAERDAATTAERERLRGIVARMQKSGHSASCASWLPGQNFGAYPLCDCWVGHVNAALADVTRALDTDTEGA
jgi:hypothetical protein